MQRNAPIERLEGLWSRDVGLYGPEVAKRLAKYGPNAILADSSSGWLEVLRNTIKDPMIWFLVGTATLFIGLGDHTEAAVLAAALIPIAGMDIYLHRRTEASTEGLRARLASQARVIRDGSERDLPAVGLVPGDLVIVPAGAYFPADGLLLSGTALQVDESTLTGEAMPVRKESISRPPQNAAGVGIEATHWGMAGTRLLTGEARLRVALTGKETLYGEIARLSSSTRNELTPLQDAIGHLVRILLVIALLLCTALAVIRYVQGYGIVDALLSAITLAIAALPEEFPVVFSFFLGLGVFRLANQQALVRRAVVVENIGRVTCICTDKTGTLTEGRLSLDHVVPAAGLCREDVLAIGATASRAETSDPLDQILLKHASAWHVAVEAVFPFTEDRLRETAIVRVADQGWRAAMKGAPETVLAMCDLTTEDRETWLRQTHELASYGHKVIAVATNSLSSWTGEEPHADFAFAGILAFSDPVRPGVREAVGEAQRAGIRVIMITGDHARTARAIAREIGIGGPEPLVIDGAGLEAQLKQTRGRIDFDVVARCTPAEKLALVKALQARGELVAVTGDGVNDAPALRGADVGIAMGERGTRSAREVAPIVLLDDNFKTIVRAIAEGRQLFVNLRLSFAYLLMLHAPLVATAALIPLLGYPLLYLPIHIVWIELIMHPTAMLVFQNFPSRDVLGPAGKRRRLRFFSPPEWFRIVLVGTMATMVILGGYIFNLGADLNVPHARSMAIMVLVIASGAITAALTRLRTRPAVLASLLPVVSGLVGTQLQPVSALLHLSPLHLADWIIAASAAVAIYAVAAFFESENCRQ